MFYLLSKQKIKIIIWCRVIKAVDFLNDPKISSQKEICAVEYQFYIGYLLWSIKRIALKVHTQFYPHKRVFVTNYSSVTCNRVNHARTRERARKQLLRYTIRFTSCAILVTLSTPLRLEKI